MIINTKRKKNGKRNEKQETCVVQEESVNSKKQ